MKSDVGPTLSGNNISVFNPHELALILSYTDLNYMHTIGCNLMKHVG